MKLMEKYNYSDVRLKDDLEGIQKLTGKKGQSALFDVANNLHRAGNPKEGNSRLLIMFVILPSRKPMGEDWFNTPSNYSLKETKFSGLRRLLRI